jgi:hypothetical protein
LLQRCHARAGRGQDDVRRERHQFRRVCAIAVGIGRSPTVIDRTLRPLVQPNSCSPAGRPRGEPVLPDRRRPGSRARQRDASGRLAVRARSSAMRLFTPTECSAFCMTR